MKISTVIIHKIFVAFSLFLLLGYSSCVEDVDFDQLEDFEAKPVLTGSIAFFELTTTQMSIADQPLDISDTTDIRVFEDFTFIEDNAYRAEVNVEIENSTSKSFEAFVFLMDDEGNIFELFTENPILIKPSNGINSTIVIKNRVYNEGEISELLNSTKFAIRFVGDEILPTDIGTLKLRSSGTVYLLL